MTWRSKKQNVVSLSSAKTEYHAFHHSTMKLTWLRIILSELGFGPTKPMVLFCDNMITIKIANNLVQCNRTKHIELDKSYIKDSLDFGMIKVPYIKSADQSADMMTHVVTSGPFCVIIQVGHVQYLCTNLREHIFWTTVIYNYVYNYNYRAIIIDCKVVIILYTCRLFYIVDYPKITLCTLYKYP